MFNFKKCDHINKKSVWKYGDFYYNSHSEEVGVRRKGKVYCEDCKKYLFSQVEDFVSVDELKKEALEQYLKEHKEGE